MNDSTPSTRGGTQHEEPPPFFGTWKRVYLAVICWLALLIALFYLFALPHSS